MNSFDNILNQGISWFTIIPLIAFLASLLWKNKQERPIARIVQFTKAFFIIATLAYAALWFINGRIPVNQRLATLYETDHFIFALQFYYDHITAVYSVVGAVLFFLVSTFSRYYMHRDEGYKRFFNTILFFAFGYNLVIFAGNFETLFIGWEIIGLSSFLLIAFYRHRYMPVKNAFKILSNYRLSDIAIILAMWMMHHLTHQNITFGQLDEARDIALQSNYGIAVFIVVMLVLAAMIKSAQLPFTSWLPRAMEGPTASSAIFYGSLSVHIGVFILLRTYPFWQDMLWVKISIIVVGVLTGILATLIARVQPTVKTQIAYSSAAQIGIIFVEVALGLDELALIHFAGNAFLRTYQLLVSPSVLNYLVHHQYFHYHPPEAGKPVAKWRAALYMLGIKEWNLDTFANKYLWSPFKWIGKQLQFMRSTAVIVIVAATGIAALVIALYQPGLIDSQRELASVILLCISLAIVLFVFAHRGSAALAWLYLLLAHLFIIAGITVNTDHINTIEIAFYASGIAAAFLLGWLCLQRTKSVDNDISLNQYHGYVYEQRWTAFLFLLAAIGMLGFPVTAAFIGIDVLFTYVASGQVVLITLLGLCFLFIELAAIRIFLRIYLGQHKKLFHPIAYRSS